MFFHDILVGIGVLLNSLGCILVTMVLDWGSCFITMKKWKVETLMINFVVDSQITIPSFV
jgi:hypothetical protein